MAKVAMVLGSKSDWDEAKKANDLLKSMGIPTVVRILSAHRTPDVLVDFVKDAERGGVKVFIAFAGLAAHLAGAVAAQTVLPVIGVPLRGGALDGLDSLLATVQMPTGVPVATVALNGGANAALLAIAILAVADAALAARLQEYRQAMREKVRAADKALGEELAKLP